MLLQRVTSACGLPPRRQRPMGQHEPGATTSADMVTSARRLVDNLHPDELEVELSNGVVLVDIREEDELRSHGWIPNSIWAPRGMLEFWADLSSSYHRDEFDPESRIILYCASGSRSALAGETLRRLGYRSVAHLDGGLKAWKTSGRSVEPAQYEEEGGGKQ